MNDLAGRYRFACEVSREAADRARHLFLTREHGQYELKGPQDYLTEADGEIERLIRGRIAGSFPEDGFFGEEGEERSTGTFTWVVDPIDGTANFARGIPVFGISVGMLHEGEPVLGIICIPMLDETFAALRGRGATLNGEPTAVSSTTDTARAMVELGWSTRRPACRLREARRPGYEYWCGHAQQRLGRRRPRQCRGRTAGRILRASHQLVGLSRRNRTGARSRGMGERLPDGKCSGGRETLSSRVHRHCGNSSSRQPGSEPEAELLLPR